MYFDSDMKIAGDKPSQSIKKGEEVISSSAPTKEHAECAERLGSMVADKFIKSAENISFQDETTDAEMLLQRRLLLSFTATVGFEQFCPDDTLCGIAQKAFLDELKQRDTQLHKASTDTGAFSFYYLAYRRGSEIDRRIGQTFAMLCLHDGDPIYQELGEALYCWFLSVVKKSAAEIFSS